MPFAQKFAAVDGLAGAVRVLIVISMGVSVSDAALEAYLIRSLDRSPSSAACLPLDRPSQVVRQIWETSLSGDPDGDRRPLPTVSRIWWGLFLVSNSICFASPSIPVDGSATVDDFAVEAVGQLVQSVIQAASGAAFLALLASLVPRHRRAIQHR